VLKQKKAEVLLHYSNFEGFGIPIKNSGLMHDKFCILDRRKIITGSMNPTFNGAYKNNNNLIIIESNYLANNYLEEFNELKAGRKDKRTEITHILFNNHSLENYFCPEDECKEKVMKHLKSAQKSIYFMTFSFTDKDIANLLIEKNKELAVRGIMEKKRINMKYNVFKMLKLGKVDVLLDENPHTFHHKVFIIDNETVITGSYNPTKSADERNDENILIISSKQTAEKYLEEWKQKWS